MNQNPLARSRWRRRVYVGPDSPPSNVAPAQSPTSPGQPYPSGQPRRFVEEIERKLASRIRFDLKKDKTFRLEGLLSDKTDKSCDYMFLQGKWSLRGSLLVLSFSIEGESNQLMFLVQRLNDREATLRSVGEASQLLGSAPSTIRRSTSPRPLEIPKDYELDVEVVAIPCGVMSATRSAHSPWR